MKVLILTSRTDLPEAHLCCGLARSGVELVVYSEPDSPHTELLRSCGIPTHQISFPGRVSVGAISVIRKVLERDRFDVVHSFSSRALTSGLLASRGLPVHHVAYRGTVGHLSRLDPAAWFSYFHPRLEKIICVSDAVRRYLQTKGIPEHRLRTIYKGHASEWYERPAADLGEFGIPSDAIVISCAANMRPVKGVDVLIEATRHLPHDRKIHLLLIGEVRDRAIAALLKDRRAHIPIHVTGFRPDAVSLVAASHISVMPSIAREGLPKAVIEAMCCGVAPVVTSVGGMPELVEDGSCGLVVPPCDPRALGHALAHLTEHSELRRSYGAAARERIRSMFTIEHTIRGTLEVYEELVSAGRHSPLAGGRGDLL
jgi:glycosyltransferase involved in cell wall biosynthesis